MLENYFKRRDLIRKSAYAGVGFMIGLSLDKKYIFADKYEHGEKLGIWIRINSNGDTTLIVPSSEMGQGVNTSLPMILAEELDADWNIIKTETAPVNPEYKNPKSHGSQMTGGSNSVKGFLPLLREVGAAAREMLKTAASLRWEVPKEECKSQKGQIIHSKTGRKLSYGELAETAGKLDIPSNPPLKLKKNFSLIGKSIPRLDIPIKVNGHAKFGIDIRLPKMLFATVKQSPVFGGEILSYDEKAAKKIKGVKAILKLKNEIAVVADNTWSAKKGMEALLPKFHEGKTVGLNSQKLKKDLITALDKEGKAEFSGYKVLDLEYEVPFLAHATLEPMNCTADVKEKFCEVWVPTQNQGKSMDVTKEITNLDEEKIKIHTTFLGGGFGRRSETDFVEQAVSISKMLKKPVQLTWMREEDIQHDYYRPACISRFQISLGNNGLPLKWKNQLAGSSILKRFVPAMGWLGFDPTSTEGAKELPYSIPDFDFDYSLVDSGIPVGFWRSVGNSYNAFFTESAIDEAAHLAKIDPLTYRKKVLKKQPRFLAVLEKLRINSNWHRNLPKGHGLGISIQKSFGSITGSVIEVFLDASRVLKLKNVWIVIDCGEVVNPDTVKSQMEGGFIFGLSSTISEQITINEGRVEQSNFHDYPIFKLSSCPKIFVDIIESGNEIGGVGEPSVALAAPALTNAIFSASGERIRSLPLKKHGFTVS